MVRMFGAFPRSPWFIVCEQVTWGGGCVGLNWFFHDFSIHVDTRVLRATELTFDLHNAVLASFENEKYLTRFAENGQHMIPIFE